MSSQHSKLSRQLLSVVAEGVFELFDEVSSIVTSKKVSDALKLKAERGFMTGSLPWGYVRKAGDSNGAWIDRHKANRTELLGLPLRQESPRELDLEFCRIDSVKLCFCEEPV